MAPNNLDASAAATLAEPSTTTTTTTPKPHVALPSAAGADVVAPPKFQFDHAPAYPNMHVFSEPMFSDMNHDGPPSDFLWTQREHFHYSRRREILRKYPQVQELYGTDPWTGVITLALAALQISMAIALRDAYTTWYFYVLAYVVGATATHALFLSIHEITHFLAFESQKLNYLLAMVANMPIMVPYSVSFKEYHFDHHVFLGVEGFDTDLPTKLEALLFNNVLGKVFFCTTQIFFYAFRPVLVRPKKPRFWHFVNIGIQLAFDVAMYYFFGFGPFIYFLLSAFLAGSLHPCAGHFLAEHYSFIPGYETYSYYGFMNMFSFNVGYHNEHHDFPKIPWSRLPAVKAMAPEFYDNLPFHTSWVQVLWRFVTDPKISIYSRTKRAEPYAPSKNQKTD